MTPYRNLKDLAQAFQDWWKVRSATTLRLWNRRVLKRSRKTRPKMCILRAILGTGCQEKMPLARYQVTNRQSDSLMSVLLAGSVPSAGGRASSEHVCFQQLRISSLNEHTCLFGDHVCGRVPFFFALVPFALPFFFPHAFLPPSTRFQCNRSSGQAQSSRGKAGNQGR